MRHNIPIIFPVTATYVINSYIQEARLFISGGYGIASVEGTKQVDPTAMSIYTLGSLPLLNVATADNIKHIAYANYISCVGKYTNLVE